MTLRNKGFIVTGAGSGLGAAVAEHLVSAGARVLLLDLDGSAVQDRAGALGPAAIAIAADVSSEADGLRAVAAAKEAFGRIDGLVNCAGIAPAKRIVGRDGAHDLGLFSQVVSVNLIGTFNMLRLVAQAMAEQDVDERGERGVIVNTASVAAFEGQIGQAAYAASKGGVVALTLPAARELARHNIRVVAIAPGIFATPMLAQLPQDVQDALGASVPHPARLGRPDEFAALVAHVIENQMLNGEVIRLDGALRMAAS